MITKQQVPSYGEWLKYTFKVQNIVNQWYCKDSIKWLMFKFLSHGNCKFFSINKILVIDNQIYKLISLLKLVIN